jgi:hypothetical protein
MRQNSTTLIVLLPKPWVTNSYHLEILIPNLVLPSIDLATEQGGFPTLVITNYLALAVKRLKIPKPIFEV